MIQVNVHIRQRTCQQCRKVFRLNPSDDICRNDNVTVKPRKKTQQNNTVLHTRLFAFSVFRRNMKKQKNKFSFLKGIHIQNDENVFLFIYLIFIYFYKIKKIWNKKLTSLQGFEKEKEKAIEQTVTTVLVFFYICTRQVYPFKFF